MMNGEGGSIPYQRIEYLQSTSTQYINTGVVQSSLDFELNLKFRWTGGSISSFETFVGYIVGSNVPRFAFSKYNSKWMFGTNATRTTSIAPDNVAHDITIVCSSIDNIEHLYIDGVEVKNGTVSYTSYILGNTLPFFLFARNGNGIAGNKAAVQIMQFGYKEFTDSSNYIMSLENNFIPCRIGNVGYMYDNVSKQLFGNAGTGDFILGPDIN